MRKSRPIAFESMDPRIPQPGGGIYTTVCKKRREGRKKMEKRKYAVHIKQWQ
jgi:hypothetical protein